MAPLYEKIRTFLKWSSIAQWHQNKETCHKAPWIILECKKGHSNSSKNTPAPYSEPKDLLARPVQARNFLILNSLSLRRSRNSRTAISGSHTREFTFPSWPLLFHSLSPFYSWFTFIWFSELSHKQLVICFSSCTLTFFPPLASIEK